MTKKQMKNKARESRVMWTIKPTNRIKDSKKGFKKSDRSKDKVELRRYL